MIKRNSAIDNMRILCTYLVVLGHVMVFFVPGKSVIPFREDEIIEYMQYALYTFHIPAFFFISGMVYHNQSQFRAFFYSKVKRLLLPYVVTFFVFVMPTLMYMKLWRWQNLYEILWNQNSRHLWFLYTLAFALIFVRMMDKIPLIVGFLFSIFIYYYGFKVFMMPFHFSGALVYIYLGRLWKAEWKIPLKIIFPLFALSIVYLEDYPLVQAFLGIQLMYTISHFIKIREQGQFDLYLFHAMIIYLILYSVPQLTELPDFVVLLVVFFATLFLAKLLIIVKKYAIKYISKIYLSSTKIHFQEEAR